MINALEQKSSPGDKATRTQWIGLAVLALPTLLVSMDSTVTFLVLPVISAELKPTSSQLLWITDIFTFLEGGLLITMGTLGDRLGRKKLLLYGAVAFAFASVLAAFSQTANMLIIARALLGIAGATLLPSTVSLIRHMFHNDSERGMAMGIWTTCFSTGTMLGPWLGGFLLHYFWWGSVFLIAVPIMLLFLILGPKLLPEYRAPKAGRLDIQSAFLLLCAILLVVYAVKQTGENLSLGIMPVLLAAAGIVVLIIFLFRQAGLKNPLIDLDLFHVASFNATLVALFLSLFCWAGLYLFITQFMQLILKFDPLKAGLWTIPGAATGMISCLCAPLLARRFGRNTVIVTGLILQSAGLLILAQLKIDNGLWFLVPVTLILTAGCSIVVTAGVDKVVSTVAPERAGAAAGIYETSTTFGSAMGVALLGSIGAAVYRGNMKLLDIDNIDPGIIDKAANTLGEALTLTKNLLPEAANNLGYYARNSFVSGFSSASFASLVLMIVVTVTAVYIYRREARDR
jgi:DHA2 family multidrug resistance protein-like MFS transporter